MHLPVASLAGISADLSSYHLVTVVTSDEKYKFTAVTSMVDDFSVSKSKHAILAY